MSLQKVCFIGSRGHWQATLREIESEPQLQIVALSPGGDRVDPIENWCREHRHEPATYEDYRKMLDEAAADMVVVCGPFERHAEMCVEAIERGIHVLTEKPAAIEFDQLQQLRDSVRRHPQTHLAGMMYHRYQPGFLTAKQLIDGGAIGDVRLINARKSYKLGKRDTYYHDRATYGGTIPWVGSHAIDWTMWFAGVPFTSVCARHSSMHNEGNGTMERSALAQFALEGERFASISIDVFRPPTARTHGDDWARIVGTDGVLEVWPDAVKLINRDNDGTKPLPVSCETTFMRDLIRRAETGAGDVIDAASTIALTDACLRARRSADERRIILFQ
jgi:predicted dehydrogenase